MTRGLRYAAVISLLVLALAALIGVRIYTLESGYEIRLRTNLMDVEPLVLGEEVRFSYEISRLNLTALPGDDQFELNSTVYVRLGRLPGNLWVAKSAHLEPPEIRRNEVVLKGEVVGLKPLEGIPPPVVIVKEITVAYGIERYAVPRGAFEPPSGFSSPRRAVTVHAAVNEQGRAVITGVRVNNEFYEEPVL